MAEPDATDSVARVMRRVAAVAVLGLAALVVTVAPEGGATPHASADVVRPNVLFISWDDVDCGQFGTRFECRDPQQNWLPKTTALILDQGVTFRRARAADPKCCSTRQTWQTGLYAHNHGLHTFADTLTSYNAMAGKAVQESLQAVGYRTILAGKLFGRWPTCDTPRGWDRFLIVKASSYYDPLVNESGACGVRAGAYSTRLIGAYVRGQTATTLGPRWRGAHAGRFTLPAASPCPGPAGTRGSRAGAAGPEGTRSALEAWGAGPYQRPATGPLDNDRPHRESAQRGYSTSLTNQQAPTYPPRRLQGCSPGSGAQVSKTAARGLRVARPSDTSAGMVRDRPSRPRPCPSRLAGLRIRAGRAHTAG